MLTQRSETEYSDIKCEEESSSSVSLTSLDSDVGDTNALSPSDDIHTILRMAKSEAHRPSPT